MNSPLALAKPRKSKSTSRSNARPTEPLRDADRTQRAILTAAEAEFAHKGLAGARVDKISAESGVNKRMLYYYFGSKEGLYIAVLERAYSAMRGSEQGLNLDRLQPLEAIRRLVEFKFDYYREHPEIIRLLAGENMHDAKYLKRSRRLRDLHVSLVDLLSGVLAAGEREGAIKSGIDPLQLYISIAGLSYFYFANAATLSAAFNCALIAPKELKKRRDHVVEVILDYIAAP